MGFYTASMKRVKEIARRLDHTHYWIEMAARGGKIIALCNVPSCRQRGEFTMEEWAQLALFGQAKNKPVRL